MPVIASDTGERLGDVTDAIVHPTEGRLLGIKVRTPHREERGVPASLFTIGLDAVMVQGTIGDDRDAVREELWSGAMAVRDLGGSTVVTEDGTLLGRVGDVFVSAKEPRVAIRVIESTVQQFFGGGFYLAGDVPASYAPDGTRLVVPSDARERFGAESVSGAFSPQTEQVGSAR
jgi:sporulation protein YlmC with PRC-barrel domain